MITYIYRSSRKPDTYLYLAEKDDFSKIPNGIVNSLGIIEFSMELEIRNDMKLAKENPITVIDNLTEHGFHLQLASDTTIESLMAKIARQKLI